MTQSSYSFLLAASEGADSPLTMIVCTIVMIPVCILLYWWMEKTKENERRHERKMKKK